MTPERKTEVNRKLRLLENPDMRDTSDAQGRPAYPDYTIDLNALARAESRIPRRKEKLPLIRELWLETGIAIEIWEIHDDGEVLCASSRIEPTRCEARAEAICQYVEILK